MPIFYADDKPDQQIISILEQFGTLTVFKSLDNLAKALERRTSDSLTLVLDIQIPHEEGAIPDGLSRGLFEGLKHKKNNKSMALIFITSDRDMSHIVSIENFINANQTNRIGYISKFEYNKLVSAVKVLLDFDDINFISKTGIQPRDNSGVIKDILTHLTKEQQLALQYIALGYTDQEIDSITGLNINGLLTSIRTLLSNLNYTMELYDPTLEKSNKGDSRLFLAHLAVFLGISPRLFNVR